MKYACESCKREWDYPIDRCIFCKGQVNKVDVGSYTVQDLTQVFVPSEDHPVTPYYVMLLKDSDGSYRFQKTFKMHEVGEAVSSGAESRDTYNIGIIGTGITGRGIAEVAVRAGNKVILKSRSQDALEKALDSISKSLSKSLSQGDSQIVMGNITATIDYESLTDADFIIESVVEDLSIKRDIFKMLDSRCDKKTVLASNTSSLLISQIAEGLYNPERIIGLHFFNPIPKMKLVEIIKGEKTSDEVLKRTFDLVKSLNKAPVEVMDTSGFIVNRLLFAMINQACRMLDSGIASVEDIDKAMKLGANYPMGPFELADLIGLDLCLEIIENLNASSEGNEFEPSRSLKEMVQKGCYGRKNRRGFYEY